MLKKFFSYISISLIIINISLGSVLAQDLPENDPLYREADTYLSDLCFSYTELDLLKDKKTISRIEAVDFLVKMISKCDKNNFSDLLTTQLPYKDISELSEDYKNSLKIAYGLGILSNRENFIPDRLINRIDLAKVSLKFYGLFTSPLLLIQNENKFSDLESTNDQAIANFVTKLGMPEKEENRFYPALALSGKEFIIWMHNIDEFGRAILNLESISNETVEDVSVGNDEDSQLNDKNIEEIAEIWNLVKKYLVSPTDKEIDYNALEEAILEGMFEQLNQTVDKYAYYVPEGDMKFTTEEEFAGIGATLSIDEDENVYIENILPDTPAEDSGLEIFDEITKVDSKVINDMTTQEVSNLIRGEEGTKVKLTVYRPSTKKTLTFTLTRSIIKVTYVDSQVTEYNGENYLYTKIITFNLKDIIDTYEEHLRKGVDEYDVKGFIIDLRDNPGGYVSEVLKLIELFLGEDKVAFSFTYADGSGDDYVTEDDKITDLPLTILVNENSASASEIFAIAMQSYERAHLIGVKTYGKFVAQQVFTLDNTTGAEIRFTIAKWSGPNGEMAPVTPDDIIEDEDDQLDAAYKWLGEQQ